MVFLSKRVWVRHANPWSGWTRVAIMPVLAIGLYLHSWWLLALAIAWSVLNPLLFKSPANINSWISRGVLGERLYYQTGPLLRPDLPTLLAALSLPAFILFIYYGWQQEAALMIFSGLLTVVLKLWFVDCMVALYDSKAQSEPTPVPINNSPFAQKQTQEKDENKRKILTMLESEKQIANNYVEKALGVSDATATRYLNELEKEGYIRQVGDVGRHVYYEKIAS